VTGRPIRQREEFALFVRCDEPRPIKELGLLGIV
jgi:hypothetical protein